MLILVTRPERRAGVEGYSAMVKDKEGAGPLVAAEATRLTVSLSRVCEREFTRLWK